MIVQRVESLNLLHHSLVIFSSNPEDADLLRALTVIISPKYELWDWPLS